VKKALTYISLVLLFVFQTSAGPYIKIFGVLPGIVLTFAVCYSLTNTTFKSAAVGLVCGLLTDSATSGAFGLDALIMMYLAIAVSYFSRKFYHENKLFAVCSVMLFTVVYETVSLGISVLMVSDVPIFFSFIRIVIPEAIYNAVITIPVFMLVKWLNNEYIRGI